MKTVIVFGPPGSGKMKYVKRQMAYGDLVIDHDQLYSCLSGMPIHDRPKNLFRFIEMIRKEIIRKAKYYPYPGTAWVTLTSFELLKEFNGCEIKKIDSTKSECYQNIMNDETRDFDLWKKIVDDWFEKYRNIQGS